MISNKLATVLLLTFVSVVLSAPTDTTPAPQIKETTPAAPSTTAAAQSSAPATDGTSEDPKTASMVVSSNPDVMLNSSSFTCYGKSIGYYGDVEQDCKVYHFCLLGEYQGEVVYQRISYLCLNETKFDQQALDCVEQSKLTAPCKDSPNYYTQSNNVLRQAIVGTQKDIKDLNVAEKQADNEENKNEKSVDKKE